MDIQTKRLVSVPCTLENYAEWSNQYEMGTHVQVYVDQLEEDSSLIGWGVWFVKDKQTNHIIGDIGFKGEPDEQKIVEVGYGILPTEQKKGFATEAVKGLIDWAFTTGKAEKVVAECFEDNSESIRVLEKVGMKRTAANNGMIYWELAKPLF